MPYPLPVVDMALQMEGLRTVFGLAALFLGGAIVWGICHAKNHNKKTTVISVGFFWGPMLVIAYYLH